jgi:hypothetical protein
VNYSSIPPSISPYRADGITHVTAAEMTRLNQENDDLRQALVVRGLRLEAATAGAFAVAGVALLSTCYVDLVLCGLAWTALVGGVWGALKIAARGKAVGP